jgi:hypothetical protein
MQQQIGSSRLPMVRTRRPPLVARGTPRSSHRTPCHDDGLDVRQVVPGYRDTLKCTRDYPSTTVSLLFFFPITDRDCVALSNVNISTSAPPIDEVAIACPPACNNSDTHGRAIYIRAIADPGGGTTYACSSPPLGRRVTADAAVRLMQVVLAPERLSASPSRTLRPVFVQGSSSNKLMV